MKNDSYKNCYYLACINQSINYQYPILYTISDYHLNWHLNYNPKIYFYSPTKKNYTTLFNINPCVLNL